MIDPAAKRGPADAPVYALSIHADYRCRRSGACCTSDWDVPVEVPLYRQLDEALAAGRLRPGAPPADGDVLLAGGDLPDGTAAMVARTAAGDCVFYDRPSGLCVVHRDLGAECLPATCRHFPRLAVRDARGTFISLTHYCPTAASMLFREDVPLEIVSAPSAFPPADYDGLAVGSDEWPPLLHPRMLTDLAGYSAWERHMVARCAADGVSPEDVVATLERDARLVRRHRPARGSLVSAVASLPAEMVPGVLHVDLAPSLTLYEQAMDAVPADLKPEADEQALPEAYVAAVAPHWAEWNGPLTRYLAAKAFASWTAYQGRGVLTIVRGLEAALAIVRVEAARQCRNAGRALGADLLREAFRGADFVLNHLAVGEDLADAWSEVEGRSKTATTGP